MSCQSSGSCFCSGSKQEALKLLATWVATPDEFEPAASISPWKGRRGSIDGALQLEAAESAVQAQVGWAARGRLEEVNVLGPCGRRLNTPHPAPVENWVLVDRAGRHRVVTVRRMLGAPAAGSLRRRAGRRRGA